MQKSLRRMDWILVGVLVVLAACSCASLYSYALARNLPLHGLHADWLKQAIFEVLGLVVMVVTALFFDYRTLRKVRWPLYACTTLLLLVVFQMPAINGAQAWIPLGGGFQLQPSELAKVSMIVLLAHYMAKVEESEHPQYGLRHLPALALILLIPFGLTLKEPALGQALVMFAIFMTMYVVFTTRIYLTLLTLVLLGLVVICGIALDHPSQSAHFVNDVLVKHHLLQSYQADRILTWLDPKYDLQHTGYNVHWAQIAIGSGQVFGEGWLNGTLTGHVPNQETDYIFSLIGDEFGFVGGSVLVFLFLILVYRLVKVAAIAQEPFGVYLAVGFVGMFAFQVFENIGMDVYLSPSTGITLPFVSYGGTSVLVNYLCVGIVLSISLRQKRLRFA
ncbi:FtsW/RodA/SpoVE family cell cycle protein [Alicyclobacillus shizuokensis]|uniref:FtsW/RodA/SpoVE family cell cycle protein n=1 Tax=Alicyclobacillus shizuokensis TaxID=392014 RepID=UPI000831C1F9|nr:FtsW/RodA/SpoVE family cell cycle protein [Alicyclobacillus shizuokensis]MCL6625468.1 rod shape-determining protein RodA [Alicyclobacillus shizuokensis]